MIPPLFKHQKDMADFILKRNGTGALFCDMGVGKTRAAIEIYHHLRQKTSNLKMLVVAPLSLLDAAWGADINKFSSLIYRNLHDEGIPKDFVSDVWLINYESFIAEKNFKALHSFLYKYPVMLVCDESSRMKNHLAKTTKLLIVLRDHAKYRLIMSGTPAPNTPLEYWGQMVFVNPSIFHPSFYAFRNSYFHLERNGQLADMHGQVIPREAMRQMMMKGWKYEISEPSRKKLMDRMSPYCYWIKKEECLDLPDMIDETRSVELGIKQRKVYNEMKRHLITEIHGADITAQAALTKIMKLREITSGFAFDAVGEAHEIGESVKLRELENIVEDIGKRPVIIWGQFQYEIWKMRQLLGKIYGENSIATLYGQTKERNNEITRFQNGDARFLLAHPRSAAHGLTFVNCSNEVFFSLDYSYEAYEQARARIHRAGQTSKCTYLHLLAKDTIDEDIMKVLTKKADVNDLLYEMVGKREEVAV